jgi:F0F1-type ATP synthase assembly protein I
MSTHEGENTEIEREIQMYAGLIKENAPYMNWSYTMIAVGTVLGIIGWVNYETSAWGILLLIGVIIGLIGVSGYWEDPITRSGLVESF